MRGAGPPPPQRAHLTTDHHLVEVPVGPGDADLVAGRLWELGAAGIEERPGRLVAAFPSGEAARGAAAAVGASPPRAVAVDEGLDGWRDHAVTVRAGPFVVHPPWIEPPAEGTPLVIDPGHVFGSGSHPSTRLALRALAATVAPGDRVLDVGCGSGILAVAAAVLGGDVVASDVDEHALAVTAANAAANGVADRVTVTAPDAVDDRFAVVVVNLTVDLHETVAADVRPLVADGGAVIVSGVLAGAQVERTAAAYDGAVAVTRAEDGWCCVTLRPRP